MHISVCVDRLVDLVVKASASRVADLGLTPDFAMGSFPHLVIPVTLLVLQWLL